MLKPVVFLSVSLLSVLQLSWSLLRSSNLLSFSPCLSSLSSSCPGVCSDPHHPGPDDCNAAGDWLSVEPLQAVCLLLYDQTEPGPEASTTPTAGQYSVCVSVEVAEGRTALNNVRNGGNGMASNPWKPWKQLCASTHSAPVITTSLSSPIKVPPTSCDLCVYVRACVCLCLHAYIPSPPDTSSLFMCNSPDTCLDS